MQPYHAVHARRRFVLVSASADAATMAEADGLGADGYIVKPFRAEDVRAQFERLAGAQDAAADEPAHEVARRLGIDGARLQLYLDGLQRQLAAGRPPQAGQRAGGGGAAGARPLVVALRRIISSRSACL